MVVRPAFVILLLASLGLSSCDETDAVALRLRLNRDLSGTIVTSTLAIPTHDGLLVQATQGANWESKVEVACAAGSFENVNQLKLADLDLVAGEAPGGVGYLQLSVPRGEGVRWALAMVPLTADERVVAATALDPSGRVRTVGTTIKFEVELPSAVVSNGLTNRSRGSKSSGEGHIATLLVPLETALTPGEPMVWHLTWQK